LRRKGIKIKRQLMNSIIYRDQNITIFQSALFQTNSTVVKTDDFILVVDPCWLPDEVMAIKHYVDSIRKQLPVYLLFTHSDYDHIIGYKAFDADHVITSAAFKTNPDREKNIEQILQFDDNFYVQRTYPIVYPEADILISKNNTHLKIGNTKMSFFLTPGHTADSLMAIVWHLGICIAGDYLSDVEFPFIYQSSVEYENTLEKMLEIHDKNWFTKLIPGHGSPALTMKDWLNRRIEGLAYIYAVRESVATKIPFDEDSLWEKYNFPRLQLKYHRENVALITLEYENGDWKYDPYLFSDKFSLPQTDVED
jgi:hydroxyacylglutathione hydrolase